MKKIATFPILLALFITACTGGESDEKQESQKDVRFYTYETAEFEILVPETWEQISSFTSKYPEELRVAFRNNIKEGDFVANLTVSRESNEQNLLNADFAQKKLKDHAATLLNYKLISQEDLTLTVSGADSKTFLNTFQGKNQTAGKTLTFKQLYLVKGSKAFIVTATYLPNEDAFTVDRLEKMLYSFALK